ncbi:MAG: cupin domain-containing protein [Syntrophorhabdales bacterium]|jgi:quercetin dioxygenase-like cupin family protein
MESNRASQADRLANIIDYQKDAIVSKEIIGKETGTVTIFAFDEGQGLSEHTAPFDAFVYVPEGRAEITIGGTGHLVAEGDMIVMPAHIPHAVKAVERFKMLLVMIRS